MDNKLSTLCAVVTLALAFGPITTILAQQPTVLEPGNHPGSPAYRSAFPDSIVSLDASLSWKNRFLGDERFNEAAALEQGNDPGQRQEMASSEPAAKSMAMDATGTIRQLRKDKLKIEHGPIDRLGMPPMTMLFRVSDPIMLNGLTEGQEIGFSVDNSSGGFTITHLMPMDGAGVASAEGVGESLDASGTVSQVRADQGKVKIRHGPIERLGMPAMTMVFKVQDPGMLEGLSRDSRIEFSVDNSSGGFVITKIRSAE